MTNTLSAEQEKFEEEFLYWVILGSTLNDGSELRWNVGDGKLPNQRVRLQTLQEVQGMCEEMKESCPEKSHTHHKPEKWAYNVALSALQEKLSAIIEQEK